MLSRSDNMNKTLIEIEKQIVADYLENFGTAELAKKYNLHRTTIQRILKNYNIPLRKRTTAAKFDIHFFDAYTVESCYWAGFIAADGNISKDRNNINIHLAISDLSHLQKFAKIIGYTGNIEEHEKDCRINIAGIYYKEALAKNFDLFPQKTKTVSISSKIPKEFLFDYIRGYFDGDGCITQANGALHISFTSGSEIMLKQLQEIFYSNNIILQSKNKVPPIANKSSINYFCKNAFNILKLLYVNSTKNTRLDRKYNLYCKYGDRYECD